MLYVFETTWHEKVVQWNKLGIFCTIETKLAILLEPFGFFYGYFLWSQTEEKFRNEKPQEHRELRHFHDMREEIRHKDQKEKGYGVEGTINDRSHSPHHCDDCCEDFSSSSEKTILFGKKKKKIEDGGKKNLVKIFGVFWSSGIWQ